MIKTISPKDVSTAEFHGYFLSAVAPRPIAFASTIDKDGNINLSPFSFFNAFGANPPILIFSPARRVRDNTTKHTLENVKEVGEVVINIVNYAMVEQTSLASTEYDKGVNEFVKAGFTQVASTLVKPPRVGESPVAFECKVLQIIETGSEGGAGNLIICEVVLAHIKEDILDEKGKIDTKKIDLVGRMGGEWYCRANGDSLFEIPKPLLTKGIGIDQLPDFIKNSTILTGNNLGRLANVEQLPSKEDIQSFEDVDVKNWLKTLSTSELQNALHKHAQKLLEQGKIHEAWLTLMQQKN
ncbi:MAG: flavin reductase family protein [Raineya sp.]|jgi:flavin reductase (DIM6/NTAB) family NADH-FMN oxidoreductase RutF|nr:flavin reductase family protein [Raineya sp.]